MRLEIIQFGDKLHINDVVYDFKSKVLVIDDITTLATVSRGLVEFERIINTVISESKKTQFLKYLYDNSQAGVRELKDHIDVDLDVMNKVIKIAYDTGIIVKKGQWRLVQDRRDGVAKFLEGKKIKSVDEESLLDVIGKGESEDLHGHNHEESSEEQSIEPVMDRSRVKLKRNVTPVKPIMNRRKV